MKLDLKNFQTHKDTSLTFPDRGVVLVTGSNGSGKSSLVEAFSYALWGKTLRGSNPWAGKNGLAAVELAGLSAQRDRKAERVSLSWSRDGKEPEEYETAGKAQDALERVVGSWEAWRRTRVFSSADAAHFSLATDGERKRLLEQMLGIDRFDGALTACRADLQRARVEEGRILGAVSEARAKVDATEKRLADAVRTLSTVGSSSDLAALRHRESELNRMAEGAQGDLQQARDRRDAGFRVGADVQSALRELRRRLAALERGTCPSCGQDIPDRLRAPIRAEIASKEAAASDVPPVVEGEVEEFQEEVQSIRKRWMEVSAKVRAADQQAEVRERSEVVVAECRGILERQREFIAKLDASEATKEVLLLGAVEQVLGLKGVRAHVLSKSLSGIEAVATRWLRKIAGPGASLRLSPYTEKKTGGVSDAISITVEGVGSGDGYRSRSAGERRRVDVSLLLALVEVSCAAQPSPVDGVLFFDEVFDALDSDGTAAVASLLEDLARDRIVFVVTHSPAIESAVAPAAHVHVEDGVVR